MPSVAIGDVGFWPISTWAPDFVAAIHRHYTDSAGAPYGKKLAWRICEGGSVIGVIGLGEPAYKLAARRRLGLMDGRPRPHTVCCFIYRLEGERLASASRILRAWHLVAAAEWQTTYGEVIEHWETLVGQGDADNLGACFKRAGYRRLAMTTGR